MSRKSYGEFAKELSGTLPYATAPHEENLQEIGGNLGPCPCPTALLPVPASPEDECCLCALSCLPGLPGNHFFPKGTPPGLLVLEIAMTKLPEVLTLKEKWSAEH